MPQKRSNSPKLDQLLKESLAHAKILNTGWPDKTGQKNVLRVGPKKQVQICCQQGLTCPHSQWVTKLLLWACTCGDWMAPTVAIRSSGASRKFPSQANAVQINGGRVIAMKLMPRKGLELSSFHQPPRVTQRMRNPFQKRLRRRSAQQKDNGK